MNFEERFGRLREASGNVAFNDALTAFLYELMRDHMSAGKVEELVHNAANTPDAIFTNGWLAKYANNLAEELTNAKTNNLTKTLTEAFGGGVVSNTNETRPSFKTEAEKLEENKQIIDGLVKAGQISGDQADEMKQELETYASEVSSTASDPVKVDGAVVVESKE